MTAKQTQINNSITAKQPQIANSITTKQPQTGRLNSCNQYLKQRWSDSEGLLRNGNARPPTPPIDYQGKSKSNCSSINGN